MTAPPSNFAFLQVEFSAPFAAAVKAESLVEFSNHSINSMDAGRPQCARQGHPRRAVALVVGMTPGAMADGNWKVGLVIDERATAEQEQAITGIGSGQAGGPVSALGPLVGTFLGAEKKPIRFERNGLRRAVTIPGVLEQEAEGVPSASKAGEPMFLENTAHPANSRLALMHALKSRLTIFGLRWDDTSGRNNGHFAPFNWQAAAAQ
jgi:hypothetical protein